MEATTYNQDGKSVGKIVLPERIFNAPWRESLVRQVVLAEQANARTPVAHTKDRGAVSGGGIKPWKQKGTGRARHGSIRSPLWRGGGTTFGPLSTRSYAQKVNRKMRAGALFSVLSKKLQDGEVLFLDQLSFTDPKTKEAKTILSRLGTIEGYAGLNRRRHAAVIAVAKRDKAIEKSFQNFGNIRLDETRMLNPTELLRYKYVIIADPESSIETLLARAT
jgi:large subunit ribosomal protein L4